MRNKVKEDVAACSYSYFCTFRPITRLSDVNMETI